MKNYTGPINAVWGAVLGFTALLLLALVGALLPSAYSAGSGAAERPAAVSSYGTAGQYNGSLSEVQISATWTTNPMEVQP